MRTLIQHRPRESTGPSLYAPDEPKSVYDDINDVCELLLETEGEHIQDRSIEVIAEYLCSSRDEYAKAKAVRQFMALIDRGETSINEAVESRRLPPSDWEDAA